MLTISSDGNNAIVTTLENVRKHPGADRLKLATVLGEQVVVGPDMKDGDVIIYFSSNLRLSPEYLHHNNLYSNPEMNADPEAKGYFGKTGRVRAQRFRGEMSNGYVADILSIQRTISGVQQSVSDIAATGTMSYLSVGDEFTHVDGVKICEKYVIPCNTSGAPGSRKKRVKEPVSEMFWKHWDTKHLLREKGRLTDGLVYIEEKIHGCVPSNTRIRMGDGTQKKISSVEVGDVVWGYDFAKHKMIHTEVKNIFRNGKTCSWLRIGYTRCGKFLGDRNGHLFCTENHEILTDGMCYKQAADLDVGDSVYFSVPYLGLSEVQRSVLIGKLLGDGSFSYGNLNQINFSHGNKQKEYFDWTCHVLGDCVTQNVDVRESGYGTTMFRMNTKNSESIKEIIESVFKEDRGVNCLDAVTPLSLAIWYMDDGNLSHTEKQRDRACFAVCRYSDDDCEKFIQLFDRFGIQIKVCKYDGYNRIRLNADDAERFFCLIRSYVPECMQYKLPEYHRGYFDELFSQKVEYSYKLRETCIDCIEEKSSQDLQYSSKWDIETGVGNYLADGMLIHNSSARTGRVLFKVQRPWWKFWAPKVTEEWRVVSGTRRVDSIRAHLHAARQEVEEKVAPHLRKGEQLYYEIYGHSKTGAEIQSGFSYGCAGGQYRVALYRVTITTPDGHCVDLSRDAVYRRAYELGLESPPLMGIAAFYSDPGVFSRFGDALWRYHHDHMTFEGLKEATRGKSTIDASTLLEGVVVWFEDGNGGWNCLKLKSSEFLLFEDGLREKEIGDVEDGL
jgi:hypothetical protein